MTRIAILCPGFGVVTRGVEVFVDELTKRLTGPDYGFAFDVYSREATRELSPGIRRIHVRAIDRHSEPAKWYARVCHRLGIFLRTRIDAECLSFTAAIAPKLLRSRYDLVFNQAGPFAGKLLRLKRRIDGTPFVHKTASGYGRLELITADQKPDAVIATSPHVRDWLSAERPSLRIEFIPNAVDNSAFRPYSHEELDAARNGLAVFEMKHPIILFVGAMDPMKRPELLISAVARLPQASLVMVGNGQVAQSVREMGGRLLGPRRFLLVPHVTREQMPVYYNACDLFTLPSEEPFGIAFLEAMACNKPVVGHVSPVQEWIFGPAGLTCNCASPDEYAAAIHRALSTNFGTKPRQRTAFFDWPRVASRYAGLFAELALTGGNY